MVGRMRKQLNLSFILSLTYLVYGCGSGTTTTGPVNNVVPLVVDSGYNGNAVNGAFITIQVCQPGTNNCQTLDHVLVDSGSTGLHIDSSQLTLANLPAITYNNNPLFLCSTYGGGGGSGYASFGSLVSADIKIGGEVARNVPLTLVSNNQIIPSNCSHGLPFLNVYSLNGEKALMGVGPINTPNSLAYPSVYTCNNNNCKNLESGATISTPLDENIVSTFTTDNNGVIFKLPKIESATNTPLIGTLTFGINTQADNLASQFVNVLLADPSQTDANSGNFITNVGTEQTQSLFDSGTSFSVEFYSPTIPLCTGLLAGGIYCPVPSPYIFSSTVSSYNATENFPITTPLIILH